jgi:hypothetical protein
MTMRKPAGFTTRRHRPSASAVAYSHALAVTKNALVAESIASSALRRGAHSRLAVIAHARHQSLEHARRTPPPQSDDIAAGELRSLATQLAATRPPMERAIVDLELRYALDPSSFARVLGLTNQRAQQRSEAITQTWADALDPAVMAWLGPASCSELGALLTQAQLWPRSAHAPIVSSVDSTGPVPLLPTGTDGIAIETESIPAPVSVVSVSALVNIATDVREHAGKCELCNERLRMLTPVRTLIGQTPIESIPTSVADAAKTAFRRIPTPLPPSIEPHRIDVSRLRVPAFTVGALAATIAVGIVLVNRNDNDEPSQADRVAKLVDSPSFSNLLATPSIVTADTKTASLANNSESPLNWQATPSVPWIIVKPSTGNLRPAQSISIDLQSEEPPSNQSDAEIVILGSDGSRQVLRYSAAR